MDYIPFKKKKGLWNMPILTNAIKFEQKPTQILEGDIFVIRTYYSIENMIKIFINLKSTCQMCYKMLQIHHPFFIHQSTFNDNYFKGEIGITSNTICWQEF